MINQTIYEFMEDHLGVYDNPYCVQFAMSSDASICVDCCWPGEEDDEDAPIRLAYGCSSIADFVSTFNITSVQQLRTITPLLMLELYQAGKAEVYSAIDSGVIYYPLYFRKENNKILVREDNDSEYEVEAALETPEEFMNYTRMRYVLYR